MKASIVDAETTGFKPLTLTIEIETEHDLVDLYHRMNFNYNPTYDTYNFTKNPKGKAVVWRALEAALKDAGIEPHGWTREGK